MSKINKRHFTERLKQIPNRHLAHVCSGFFIFNVMKQIQLSRGMVALVDDEDFEYLNQFKWCAYKVKNTFYAVRHGKRVNGKQPKISMHSEIMGSKMIDHERHDGLNNQRFNLRKCTSSQNNMNRLPIKNASSKYKGICWHKVRNKWICSIRVNGKLIHLGYFADEIEAAKTYDEAAKKYFGEFAWLNFINLDSPLIL